MDASWDDEVSNTIIKSLTLNLTSDLVSRNWCISPIYSLKEEFQIWYVNAILDA